ncbi:Glycosyltransferase involved in cell wall bisynthesis [Fontimonas thermophila]|uniref:Glycosyltransferase involved in cell wall bisynthesis n=1 Tax=Fontimonas thermophila TaxID=1076937 RepID=A0A1I2K379_9GAMM|nr:glycosyltransferase family 4 protein [Fontimonas thermophila]SFF60788.1 Glycosyltransferase involved in cell wall bisynthesis [Fontimonas thermophila]
MSKTRPLGVWLPAVRTATGTDRFTEQLADGLLQRGIRAEISWLPHRAEYAPQSVPRPRVPDWVSVVHVASWLSPRFVPQDLPLVATVHLCVHTAFGDLRKPWLQRLYHRWKIYPQERALLAQADVVAAVSRATAEEVRRAFPGIVPVVVHNGVANMPFTAAPMRPPGRTFRVLYCGNWSRRKGVDLLPPMLAALGEGFELIYTVDRHGGTAGVNLPANARALPRIDGAAAMAEVYRAADVLVFPSRHEGLPLVPLEAMSHGLPVVATTASSVVEIIEDGVSGLLVPPDDAQALAAAIRRLRDEPALWAALSAGARARQRDGFSLDAMVDRYIGLYERALARRGTAARTAADGHRRRP